MAMLNRVRPRGWDGQSGTAIGVAPSPRSGRPRRGGQGGSGTAIGVAVVFPMLMLVIVALRMLTDTSHLEQGIQATANQAARTAALCCLYTGHDPNRSIGAEAAAEAVLDAAEGPGNRIECINDFVGDANIVFADVDDRVVTVGPDVLVPAGGTVYVRVTCQIPPSVLGSYGILGLDARRSTTAVASINPYQNRSAA